MTTAHGIIATLEEEIPRLRGVIHAVAWPVVLLVGVVLATRSDSWRSGAALLLMAGGYAGIFATSSLYHRRQWSPRVKRFMRQLDHTMIFVGIASVYTALWLTVLEGTMANAMLVYVWVGTVVGALMKFKFLDARASRHAMTYIAFALVGLVVVPSLFERMHTHGVYMLLGGGLAFALGAIAFATQRPNPFPNVLGHHEIFHATTVIGACLHLAALASVVLR